MLGTWDSQKTITSALEDLSAELGISQVDFAGRPGLQGKMRPEFELPMMTATGPLGEVSVLPPPVELSEFRLGPRFSSEPNGASKLDWSAFTEGQL